MQSLRVFDDLCDRLIRFIMVRSGMSFLLLIFLTIGLFLNNIISLPQLYDTEASFAFQLQSFFIERNIFDFNNDNYLGLFGYWIHIPFTFLLGEGKEFNIISYRIISLIGGIGLVISTFILSRRLFGREAGFIAGIMTILPLIFHNEIIFSGTTTLLAAMIVTNYYALSCLWRRDTMGRDMAFCNRHFFTFWLSLIVAALLSGLALFLIIIPIISLSLIKKDIQWLAPLQIHFGAIISAIIVIPPLLIVSHLSDLSLVQIFFGTEDLKQLLNGDLYSDYWPFQYFLGHIIWGWPVILLTPVAIYYSLKNKADERFVFAVWTTLPLWLLAEILPIKFMWIGLILTILVISLIAGTFIKFINDDYQMPKGVFLISVTLYLLISLCIAVKLPYMTSLLMGDIDAILIMLAVLSLVIALINVALFSHNMLHGLIVGLFLQIVILFTYFNNSTLHHLHILDTPSRIAQAIERTGCEMNAVYISGYDHTNLKFRFGKNISFMTTQEMNQNYERALPCTIFIIGENHKDFVKYGSSSEIVTVFDMRNYNTILLEVYKR